MKEDKPMKIVVLGGYTENPEDLSWDELGKLGELTVYDRTPINVINLWAKCFRRYESQCR